ncbi:hypothetical protein K525DRAFT_273694 [Schizophyllum commune Loenen D]|nr:hypothetical protein K525DRAFT_273694 [Schizophyllum commune Loenen D]
MDTITLLDEPHRRWTRAEKGKWRADIAPQDVAQLSPLPATAGTDAVEEADEDTQGLPARRAQDPDLELPGAPPPSPEADAGEFAVAGAVGPAGAGAVDVAVASGTDVAGDAALAKNPLPPALRIDGRDWHAGHIVSTQLGAQPLGQIIAPSSCPALLPSMLSRAAARRSQASQASDPSLVSQTSMRSEEANDGEDLVYLTVKEFEAFFAHLHTDLDRLQTEMEEKDSMRFGDDDTDEEGRDDDVFDEGRDEEDGGRTDDEDRADIADEDEQAYSENSDDDEQGYLEDSDEDVEDVVGRRA